jgi:Xaa-Pro aminopeptidase
MHASHRAALLDRMQDGDVAVLSGARLVGRNHDVDHPFRQESGFWYLSGCPEPEALLLLAKGVEGVPAETLFVLPRDPERETWDGIRLGPEGARSELGFGAAEIVDAFPAKLEAALAGARRAWCRLGADPALDRQVVTVLTTLRRKARLGLHPPEALMDLGLLLDEMRVLKSAEELDLLRRAAAITVEGHLLAMAQAAPGGTEHGLEALLHYTFRRHGGHAGGWAYPSIVASGSNACILHYTQNDQPLRGGDLVLIDAGAEYRGYAGDVTRTFPVDGSYTAPQRDVYEVVLQAQLASIDEVRAGRPYGAFHDTAVRALCEGLRELGVLTESVDTIVEEQLYRPWYMHNTGHYLGLDVHDAGRYVVGGSSRPLEPGMVLTVEPGLYFRADDERVPEPLRGIGVRIEDDVHVTGGDPEVLTAAAPKTVADVEAACAARRAEPPQLDSEVLA